MEKPLAIKKVILPNESVKILFFLKIIKFQLSYLWIQMNQSTDIFFRRHFL